MYESSPVFVLKLGFLIHLFVWQLSPSPYTFLAKAISTISVKRPLNKGKR